MKPLLQTLQTWLRTFSCMSLKCCNILSDLLKDLSHFSHLNVFFWSWTWILCLLSLSLLVKVFPQSSQSLSYISLSSWMLMIWSFISLAWLNVFPHISHMCGFMFSCTCMICFLMLSNRLKAKGHISHWKSLIFLWTALTWFFKLSCLENKSGHSLHFNLLSSMYIWWTRWTWFRMCLFLRAVYSQWGHFLKDPFPSCS